MVVEALEAMSEKEALEMKASLEYKGTSIGKRYAWTNEIGVPFAVIVDSTDSVMIRESDSKEQICVRIDEAASVVKELVDWQSTWSDIMGKYSDHAAAFSPQSNEE